MHRLKAICLTIIAVIIVLSGMFYTYLKHLEKIECIKYQNTEIIEKGE